MSAESYTHQTFLFSMCLTLFKYSPPVRSSAINFGVSAAIMSWWQQLRNFHNQKISHCHISRCNRLWYKQRSSTWHVRPYYGAGWPRWSVWLGWPDGPGWPTTLSQERTTVAVYKQGPKRSNWITGACPCTCPCTCISPSLHWHPAHLRAQFLTNPSLNEESLHLLTCRLELQFAETQALLFTQGFVSNCLRAHTLLSQTAAQRSSGHVTPGMLLFHRTQGEGRHTCALCCSPKNVGQCQITELYSMPARGCAGNGNMNPFSEMDTVVLR